MATSLILISVTLVAFAANSILCRMALMTHAIGPVQFTILRLASGAVMLSPLLLAAGRLRAFSPQPVALRRDLLLPTRSHLGQAAALFSYALFFSLAYIELEAGTGALILFPSVQLTMMGISVAQGNRVTAPEVGGFGLALSGLVYLLLPGVAAPSWSGTLMMALSGVSWGVYSMLGRNSVRPILATARNFLFCLPACLVLVAVVLLRPSGGDATPIQASGLLLAILSGAVASAGGYVLWYLSLRSISTTAAAIGQLAVPVIAAGGGIIFLQERLTTRLLLASVLIFSGIVLAVLGRRRQRSVQTSPAGSAEV
jgi:drug/metabolite transporter (DMT)-like permease